MISSLALQVESCDKTKLLPEGFVIKEIPLESIYPLDIYTPLENRMKYRFLITHSDIPDPKFLMVSKDMVFYCLDYSEDSFMPMSRESGFYGNGVNVWSAIMYYYMSLITWSVGC